MQQRSTTKGARFQRGFQLQQAGVLPKVRAARKRASKSPVNPSSLLRQSANVLTRL